MDDRIAPVEPAKAYRLINHGPTVLVSARHAGEDDVMAAAWACALDFSPPKLTVVLDKATRVCSHSIHGRARLVWPAVQGATPPAGRSQSRRRNTAMRAKPAEPFGLPPNGPGCRVAPLAKGHTLPCEARLASEAIG